MYSKEGYVYHNNNRSFYFDNNILLAICLQLNGYIAMYELGIIR